MNQKDESQIHCVQYLLGRKMKLAKPSVRLMVSIFLWLKCLFAITGHCSKMNNLKGKQLRVVTGHVSNLLYLMSL